MALAVGAAPAPVIIEAEVGRAISGSIPPPLPKHLLLAPLIPPPEPRTAAENRKHHCELWQGAREIPFRSLATLCGVEIPDVANTPQSPLGSETSKEQ